MLMGLLCLQAHAQITMTVQVPPTGVLMKPQVWNMVLVNSNTTGVNVQLSLVLTDANTHQPVLSATTQPFVLAPGAMQVQSSALSINYTYESSSVPDQDPNGFLGVGNYQACYTLDNLSATHTVNTTVEDCVNFTVEPLSPPMLLMPEDQAILDVVSLFNWLPPAPLNIFSNLNYDCIVVEVQPGQTSSEAIQQNIPIVHNNGTDMFLNSSLNPSFDTGKLYAWQVVAKNGNEYAAPSEVWTFKLKTPQDSIAPFDSSSYILLSSIKILSGIQALHSDTLHIKYHSYSDDNVSIKFINSDNELVYEKNLDVINGDNFYAIPLSSLLKKEEIYSAEITAADNSLSKIFFTRQ